MSISANDQALYDTPEGPITVIVGTIVDGKAHIMWNDYDVEGVGGGVVTGFEAVVPLSRLRSVGEANAR